MLQDKNITVVGLGLIGGSFAMALRDLKPRNLWGIEKNPEIIKSAVDSHILDAAPTDGSDILANSDIIIVALYPKNTVQFISQNKNLFKRGCVITDTSGIKGSLVYDIQNTLDDSIDFIGGHPLAGKAENGYINADKNIFKDSNYIITPTHKNKRENINMLADILKAMHCKSIIEMSPEEHDRIIAYTSQLPHVIAVSLINSLENQYDLAPVIGGSFKDASRVAVLNSELWCELLEANSENILRVIEGFEKNVQLLKGALIDKDKELLTYCFQTAYKKRKEIS
jgi:prephenate dehydrogenase